MIKAFLMQLGLYTTLYSNQHDWDDELYKKGLVFTPLIGLIIGGLLYLAYRLLPSPMHSFFLMLFYILLTGGLHLDGYSDTLDGILARRGRDRALEIMQDPLLGSFGILGLIVLLLAYFNFLPDLGLGLLFFPIFGRLGALLAAYGRDYARKQGMGKLFMEGVQLWMLVIWLPLSLVVFYLLTGLSGLIAGALSLAYSYFIGKKISNFLGGMTGDTLGFVIESSQLVFIIIYLLVVLWI